MARYYRSSRRWIITGVIAVLAIIVGVWLYQSLSDSATPETPDAEIIKLDTTRPQLIDTQDALTRFVERETADDGQIVNTTKVHLPESVDWNTEVVVAIEFDALEARAFRGATIETVDDTRSYVIDLLDVAKNCVVSQVNVIHIAFIKQTSRDTSLPVIMRVTPNMASCPL